MPQQELAKVQKVSIMQYLEKLFGYSWRPDEFLVQICTSEKKTSKNFTESFLKILGLECNIFHRFLFESG